MSTPTGPGPGAGAGTREKQAAPRARALAGGFGWETGALIAAMVLQLGYGAWTGRHLSALHFGAYATATAVVHVSASLTSGLTQYVLTSRERGPAFLAPSLLLAAGTGAASCLFFEAVAPLWGLVFSGVPYLVDFVRILVLQNLIAPVAAVCTAALRGELRFRTAALLELGGQAVGWTCALSALIAGWIPYGVALSPVLSGVVPCVGGLVLLRGMLRGARWERPGRELWLSLRSCAAFTLVQSLTYNLQVWSAALVLGASGTGHFSRAVYFVSMVSQTLTQALVRTSTPLFTRLAETPERLAGALRDALTVASGLLGVCLGVVAGVGPVGLLLLLGPGWEEAAALVVWFVPGLALQVLCTVGYQADRVRGDVAGVAVVQRVVLVGMLAGVGVAAALADARLLALALLLATGAGHAWQLRRWRRLPGWQGMLGEYAVHTALGAVVAGAARLGSVAQGGGPGLVPLVYGLLAGGAATACAWPVRRWIPALRLASAHGLLGRKTAAPPAVPRQSTAP
ncbi:hypothetical protein SSPIM334S_02679 [Streptomyces spiroverticillatus]